MRLSLAAALLCLLAWLAVAPVQAQPVNADVSQLHAERTDEGVMVSATVRFELPTVVDDALAKGIPMYFVAEATLLQDRWYWYDRRVGAATRHMRLSFQPLTRRWRLQVSPTPIGNAALALGQTFESREEALAAIQRIARWKIAEPGEVDPDGRYTVDFRFRLDVSQLPRPFQIGAVGQADWNIVAARAQRLGAPAESPK